MCHKIPLFLRERCPFFAARLESHALVADLVYFFLPLLAAFLAAGFLAAFGLLFDLALADFAEALPSAASATGFTFLGLRAGSSGALWLSPSKAISVILTAVNGWRCPYIFLYCFLRLKWKTRI